jgi:VanZ family protein
MSLVSKKYYSLITVIGFAFFIFFLSAIPDLKSGLDTTLDIILRKIAHTTEFGILNYLIFLALANFRLSTKKSLLFALILAFLYVLSDEFHQSFVPGREMAFLDFLVDSTGIALSFYLIWASRLKDKKADG